MVRTAPLTCMFDPYSLNLHIYMRLDQSIIIHIYRYLQLYNDEDCFYYFKGNLHFKGSLVSLVCDLYTQIQLDDWRLQCCSNVLLFFVTKEKTF